MIIIHNKIQHDATSSSIHTITHIQMYIYIYIYRDIISDHFAVITAYSGLALREFHHDTHDHWLTASDHPDELIILSTCTVLKGSTGDITELMISCIAVPLIP